MSENRPPWSSDEPSDEPTEEALGEPSEEPSVEGVGGLEDVDRRFEDIVGRLGPGFLDGRDTPATRHLGGRVVREPHPQRPQPLREIRPLGPRDYEETPEAAEDFVPPDPGPVEVQDPRRLLAGLMVVVPALVIFTDIFLDLRVSGLLLATLGLSVVVGTVWFISLLPRERDPGDPGAVV